MNNKIGSLNPFYIGENMKIYETIVIGAGPAGCEAAIRASNNKTLLLDGNDKILKKLEITGGGRCNLLNLKDNKEFIQALPNDNGRFLHSSLSKWGAYDIYYDFLGNEVQLKIEDNDRVFPESDKASTIVDYYKERLKSLNVDVVLNAKVSNISKDDIFEIEANNCNYYAKKVVIATGGKSYPHLGSDGSIFKILKKLGHTTTEFYPCESPILSNDKIIASGELMGVSLSGIELKVDGVSRTFVGDMIFTHFGLSGPAALMTSQFVYKNLKNGKVNIMIDFLPLVTGDYLVDEINKLKEDNRIKSVNNALSFGLPKKLIKYILEDLSISNKKMTDLSKNDIIGIVDKFKNTIVSINGVRGIEKSFVTGGGIDLREVNPKTMESKIVEGLYFAGEVLDLHGFTGGYNITIALSTGYTAGINTKER